MVAIRYDIFTKLRRLTLALATSVCLVTLHAQPSTGVTPRIEELAGDSTYMSLLALDAQYGIEGDSLSQAITKNRELFLAGGDKAFEAQSMIMSLEQSLFNLRTKRNTTTQKIDQIESDWIANNTTNDDDLSITESDVPTENHDIYPTEIVGRISQSGVVSKTLSKADLASLIKADNNETRASQIYNKYIDSYLRASELQQLYNQTESEPEALAYEDEFDTLVDLMDSLSSELSPMWSTIYDDKLFIYSLLLETLNNNEVLDKGLNNIRKAEVKSISVKDIAASPAVVDYMHKKLAMVEFENQIAERFNLPRAADSLLDVSRSLMVSKISDELPELTIKARSFIPYEPITFTTNIVYNDSLPIPQTPNYERGAVYRVQLGSYRTAQKPEIFKGASPLSHEVVDGMHTYYGGSYASYVEATEAIALIKAQGFNRPEMVVWRNGERRNLFRDPLPSNSGYNLVIDGLTTLAGETGSFVDVLGGGAKLVRISTDKYVISPLKNVMIAADVETAVSNVNRDARITLTEIQ